jgi:hypothetical protein
MDDAGPRSFVIIAVLVFLVAMYQREKVKSDLLENDCAPLHIWWCPAAYWAPTASLFDATPFRVIYRDADGVVHKAYCCTHRSFVENPRWGSRTVRWLADTAVGVGG